MDIGDDIIKPVPTAAELYERYSFHGPQYHSSTRAHRICSKGCTNSARKAPGKGSLLDIMGQELGLFLHLTQTENTISFPVNLKELTFYADYTDQSGDFEHTMVITDLTDQTITGEMLLTRDGAPWSHARGFICQRFHNDRQVWFAMMNPQKNLAATRLAPGVYHYRSNVDRNALGFLALRYLSATERGDFTQLGGQVEPGVIDFLAGRIALRDAVRDHIRTGEDPMAFPIEIAVSNDADGAPVVNGIGDWAATIDPLRVSVGHSGGHGLAMVAEYAVGVDIEVIQDRSPGFVELTFTAAEQALLAAQSDLATWQTRYWVAKEACGKALGTGLGGNPKNFEVIQIDGDTLTVSPHDAPPRRIQLKTLEDGYIAGWTIN
jgi:phosphopantetheinyl transferase (holo-ACP synthase)